MPYTLKYGDRPLEGVTIQRAVGRGGFGEVYYAVTDSGKQLAVKYLRENADIELRGIAHVMNLKSPHLITIYDVRRNAVGEPFVLMEYVSGPSLRELLIAEPGGLGPQKAAFFLKGIAAGLSYLHERGIVHRDLKPANIFYDDGYVKIGDYGLSKHMSVSQHSGQTVSVGTVHYMAPEIGSGSYTQAIDIYALGVILYEMLTGRLPFSGSSMAEILMRHLRDNPDLSGVPAPFAAVIAKALAKDPAQRWRSADEMAAAVLESAGVADSVSTFDASVLTRVRRVPEALDPERTRTTPHRPPALPSLDARDLAVGPLPPRIQRRLDRLTQRLDQKAARLEREFGLPRRGAAQPAGEHVPVPLGHRLAHVFTLGIIALGLAVVFALVSRGGNTAERAVVLALYLTCGTAGPLLAHGLLVRRTLLKNWLFERAAYAGFAALFMMVPCIFAHEEVDRNLAPLVVAPLAAMVITDWRRRIEDGRTGRVEFRAAFWPALIGLIACGAAGARNYEWVGAGVNAAITLLTQAGAALWPCRPGSGRRAAALANGALETVGFRPVAPEDASPPVPDAATTARPTTEPPPAAPVVLETFQPSFVGRTASAGVSLLGKLLLTVALAVALGQGAVREQVQRGALDLPDPALDAFVRDGAPPGLVLGAAALGVLLLVFARRRAGGRHMLRGCLGGALVLWSITMALTAAGPALARFWTSRDVREWHDVSGAVLVTLAPLLFGAVLLLWRPASVQRERTIVI